MSIGEELYEWRKSLGISQEEAAKRLDLARPYYSEIERGVRSASAKTIRKFRQISGENLTRIGQAQNQSQEPLEAPVIIRPSGPAVHGYHEGGPDDMRALVRVLAREMVPSGVIALMATIGGSELSQESRRAGLEALVEVLKAKEQI